MCVCVSMYVAQMVLKCQFDDVHRSLRKNAIKLLYMKALGEVLELFISLYIGWI